MKRIITIILGLMTFGTLCTQAQSTMAVQYTINFPMGNTNDFISKVSCRGVTLDYRYAMTPSVAVGFSVGWYGFYEKKAYGTYVTADETAAISGTQYRYLNSVPLLAVADYYFMPEEKMSPFIGLGIGTTYNRAELEMGLYSIDTDPWQFSLAPEAGFRYGVKEGAYGLLSVRYNTSFEAGDLDTQSYLSLNIGVMINLH